jgi:hypothetical protein
LQISRTAAFHLSGVGRASWKLPPAAPGIAHPALVFTGAAGENWNPFVAVEGTPPWEQGRTASGPSRNPRRITASPPLYHPPPRSPLDPRGLVVATRAWQEARIQRARRPALAALAAAPAPARSPRLRGCPDRPIARRWEPSSA